jgi:hypothetical protein
VHEGLALHVHHGHCLAWVHADGGVRMGQVRLQSVIPGWF